MSELKRCHFCGGAAEFYRTPIKTNGGWCDSVVVRCKACEARTGRVLYDAKKHPNGEEYEEAAKAWNTRKPMERIVERLKEVNKTEIRVHSARCNGKTLTLGFTLGIKEAIEIVKGEGGMNEKMQ